MLTAPGGDDPAAANGEAPSGLAGYRDLFLNLVHAELTTRYKNTVLGLLWFILTPVFMTLILVVVFQHVVRLGIPDYPFFVLAAMLPWSFFQTGMVNATGAITRFPALIKRVRIPRVLVPLAAITASLVHFLLSLAVLLGIMTAFGARPSRLLLFLPVVIALHTVCLTGLGLVTCSLNVFYRDVGHVVPVMLRLGFYLTPSFYPLSYVPSSWLTLYLLNPMAGLVELYRSSLVTGARPAWRVIAMTTATSVVALAVGIGAFRRSEPYFEDYV